MPSIIDQDAWEAAQEKRLRARNVRREPKNWLLQGLCICGECGHVYGCQQKNSKERRYYSCQGRDKDTHLDGSPKCVIPRIRADELEKAVWRRLKAVMTDHEALRDSLRNTLDDLKQRKNSLSTGWVSKEKELRVVYEKKERLGLIYADLAITKEKYEKEMNILKKKESELLKARTNLDPKVKIELDDLERAMASLEKAIDGKTGKLFLTELGVWVESIPDNWIVGHSIPCVDSWDKPNALIDTGSFQIGEHRPLMTMVDGPVQSNFEVPRETVLRNIRSILNWLGIRIYIFKDRVEIRGFIPTEVIDIPGLGKDTNRGPIIPSSILKGRGIKGDRFT